MQPHISREVDLTLQEVIYEVEIPSNEWFKEQARRIDDTHYRAVLSELKRRHRIYYEGIHGFDAYSSNTR